MQVLESEALADFLSDRTTPGSARSIAIAVNDDSLETWFVSALAQLHQQRGYLFDVRVDDQDHTLELLRNGSVLGAVTAESKPLQGCNVHVLGTMRYHAIASPAFAAHYFARGVDAQSLARAPMMMFNRKDVLRWRFVRCVTRARITPPIHYLPTASGSIEAAARGLGRCPMEESLAAPALKARRVVIVDPARWLDVWLYWQHAAVRSNTRNEISRALRSAAAAILRA